MNSEPTTNFVVRLPKPLHKKLRAKADKNVRSLNSEIIVAVQKYVSYEELPEVSAKQAAKAAQTVTVSE